MAEALSAVILVTLIFTGSIGFLIISLIVPLVWINLSLQQVLFLILLASIGTVGHFLIILSLRLGEASKLAPLGYFEISTNILVGYVFFDDLPDIWIYLGLLLIVMSGIYIFIRENKTFIAKKSKTFDEEKKVANKAPVKSISINEIGTPKSKELDDRRSFNYSIKITEFYFLKNAKELKKRIENDTSLKNINIISINDTKHQVLLGPYSNINTLQSAYNSINNLNFENIELIRND